MKINTYLKTISILVVIISLMAISAFASKGDPSSYIRHSIATNDQLEVGSIVHYTLGITPIKIECDEISVSVETDGGLIYFGQTFWSVPFKENEETFYSFDIQIPDNDTSGFVINLSCGDTTLTINRNFITTSDSVEYIIGRLPTFSNEYIRPDYEGRVGNVIPGEFPEEDRLYGIPENHTMIDYERDSSYQMTKEEAQLRKMHRLEREPLTDKDRENFWVGSQPYVRYRGEYKFTKRKTYTDETMQEHIKQLRDSLTTRGKLKDYDLTLDLTNKEDYEFVKQLVDNLIPTDSIGFYRVVVSKSIINELTFNNINYKRTFREKSFKMRDEKDRPSPKKKTD